MDAKWEFYKALGGGQLFYPIKGGKCGALLAMLNPCSQFYQQDNRQAMKTTTGNMKGEGLVAGGVYVLRPDGGVAYSHLEETIGKRAPLAEVLSAIKMASWADKGDLAKF